LSTVGTGVRHIRYVVGEHFDRFIREQVESGRYNKASEVVRVGLRLVEEREAKLQALKDHIAGAIERVGAFTDADIEAALRARG
jgi:antitoxin ParD1/3/4